MPLAQQEFLRNAAATLGMTQQELAERMHAPWTTFKKWLHPSESENYREMPAIAWQLVREIIQHEELKQASTRLKAKPSAAAPSLAPVPSEGS